MTDPEDAERSTPEQDTEAVLQDAATAVADVAQVDWDARAAPSPAAASRLQKLKVIEALARAFRDASPATPAAEGPAPLGTWSHLQLISKLGEGSFGEVYRAHDPILDRQVALKLSKSRWRAGEERRYLEEARRLARVRHPNVVVVHGAEIHDGRVGLWTDLVEGETLEALLARSGPLAAREAARMGADLCRALAAVHAQGLVHGDVKASNVMRDRDGRVVLMDFGTVKETSGDGRDAVVTRGTPLVLAPELLRGEPPTAAADLYSVGVLLYQLLTGRYPVEGATLGEVMRKHAAGEVTPLRERRAGLPEDLFRQVEQALDGDPRRRPASAEEMERLLSAAAGEPGSERPRRHRRVAVAASLAAVAAATAGALLAPRPGGRSVRPRASVAVLGFKNLSGRADTAWLSTALSEMLATELSAGERLRTIRGEDVERMKLELALGESDALAADTLGRVRRNLGADFVALGSYVALGTPGGRLRVDVRLQDAGAGSTVLSVSEEGSDTELLDLVARTGARLRARLGGASAASAGRLHASLPKGRDAARWYAEGLARLRVFDANEARSLLERAVAAQPEFALGHSALSAAWTALGYEARAREEARRAFELSAVLPREEAQLVEGRYYEAAREWDKAIALYRSLAATFPDDLEYGLRLAEVQTAAGRGKDALATVDALRRLPAPASDDPRIDLAEASAADASADDRRSQAAAARAAEKGVGSGARSIVARARLLEGQSWSKLGEPQPAMAATEEARALFAELDDTLGVARALNQTGNLLRERGELARAKAVFEQVLSICREVGFGAGAGTAMTNTGLVLRQLGDPEGAEAMFRQALAVNRETRNVRSEAGTLNNLAIVLRQRGQLKAAVAAYQESLDLYRQVGDKRGVARQFNNIANVLFEEGELARAQGFLEQGLVLARELGDRRGVGIVLHNLGDLRHQLGELRRSQADLEEALALRRATEDRTRVALTLEALGRLKMSGGDLAGARVALEEAAAICAELGDKGGVDPRVSLAALAIEEGRPREGMAGLRAAIQEVRKQDRPSDETHAQLVLAAAAAASGEPAVSRSALERALSLSARSENAALRLEVTVEAARIRQAAGTACAGSPATLRALERAVGDAAGAGWVALELNARLALGATELACGRVADGRACLTALEKAARQRGFVLMADKARQLAERR